MQGFIHFNLINAWTLHFTLYQYVPGALVLWQADISLRKNGNDVSRLQLQIARLVLFQDGFARAHPKQLRGEIDWIYTLDYGVVPVNFRCVTAQIRGHIPGCTMCGRDVFMHLNNVLIPRRHTIIGIQGRIICRHLPA